MLHAKSVINNENLINKLEINEKTNVHNENTFDDYFNWNFYTLKFI
jgi:hypothetical protein